jgi:hypothetical protein
MTKPEMPFFSPQTADLLFTIANWMLAGGALIVLGGAALVAWTTPMREHYSDVRISANELAAAQANERAGEATKGAAEANERLAQAQERIASATKAAAEANEKAEAERLERLKLELKLAPRVLGATVSQKLASRVGALASYDVDIISYEHLGNDIPALALELKMALALAHVHAEIYAPMADGSVIRGILVRTEDGVPAAMDAAADQLVAALKETGLAVSKFAPYPAGEAPAGGYNGPGTAKAKFRLLIGSKPQ